MPQCLVSKVRQKVKCLQNWSYGDHFISFHFLMALSGRLNIDDLNVQKSDIYSVSLLLAGEFRIRRWPLAVGRWPLAVLRSSFEIALWN
jgi:hypothetical protein